MIPLAGDGGWKRVPRSEIQAVAARGECVATAAARLGMSIGSLRKRLAKLGHQPAQAAKFRGRSHQADGTWVSLDALETKERDRLAVAEYLNRADLPVSQLAKKHGLTAGGLYHVLARYNVPKRRASFDETPQERAKRMGNAVKAYCRGIPPSEVAAEARMSLTALYAELEKRGVKERPRSMPFAGKPKDKAKLLRIAASIRAGMSRRKIALLEGLKSANSVSGFYRYWLKRWGEERMAQELEAASNPPRESEEGDCDA